MTSTQRLNCVFCSETFADKETLQEHFRKHGDPKFSSPRKGSDDSSKEKQSTDLVGCDVCTETFPTISKAITHKHKAHPDHDAKHFCSWCGKLFTLKFLYNKHMVTHEPMQKTSDTVFPCDVCSVEFYIPSAMIYHNKFFHRQDAELLAIGHSKKQKFIDQELFPLYYCPFCGDENINKVNLHKHIEDDHCDENQSPDEVLKCPLCEAIFYHLDAYQIHLTFHSTDDVYNGQNVESDYHTEFSLETAPPIIEKVGDLDIDADSEVMDLDQLLRVAMNESQDSSKTKKKKKHKKSKKETITLDEFLNMNKDVFGEEVDVHGIEEVPSKMIAKRLKTTEKVPPPNKLKVITRPDMERLKQQGVIIKLTPTSKPKHLGENTSGFVVGKALNISKTAMDSIQTSSSEKQPVPSGSEIASKLINNNKQGITVMKKPTEAPIDDNKHLDKPDLVIKPFTGNHFTKNDDFHISNTPESLEVDCDPFPKDSSETEVDNEIETSKVEDSGPDNCDESNTQTSTSVHDKLDLDESIPKSKIDVNNSEHSDAFENSNGSNDNIDKNSSKINGQQSVSIENAEKQITDLKCSHRTHTDNGDSIVTSEPLVILKKLGITIKSNKKSTIIEDNDKHVDDNIHEPKKSKTVAEQTKSNPIKDTHMAKVVDYDVSKPLGNITKNSKDLEQNLNKIAHCLKKTPKTMPITTPSNRIIHTNSEPMQDDVYDDDYDGDDIIPSDFDVSDEDNVDAEKTKNASVIESDSKCLAIKPNSDSIQKEPGFDNKQSEDEITGKVMPPVGDAMNIANRLSHAGLTVKSRTQPTPNKNNDCGSKESSQTNKPFDTLKHLQHLTVKPVTQMAMVSASSNNNVERKPKNVCSDKNVTMASNYVHNRQVINKVIYSKEDGLQKKSVCTQKIEMKKMESQYEQSTSRNYMSDDFSDDDFERLDGNLQNNEKLVRIKIINKMQPVQNTNENMKALLPKTENNPQIQHVMKPLSSKEETVTDSHCSVVNKSSLTGVLSNLSKSLTVKPLNSPIQKNIVDEPEVYNIDDSDSEDTGKIVDDKKFNVSKEQKDQLGVHVSEQPIVTKPQFAKCVNLKSQPRISPKHKLYIRQGDDENEPNTKLMKTDPSHSNISKLINNKNISFKNKLNNSEITNKVNKPVNSCKVNSDVDDDSYSFEMSGEDDTFTDDDDEPLNAIKNKTENQLTPKSKNNITLENFNDTESEDDHNKNSEDENCNESIDNTNQSILNKLNSNLNLSIKSNNQKTGGKDFHGKIKDIKSNTVSKQLVKLNTGSYIDNSEKHLVQTQTNQHRTVDKTTANSTVSQHVTQSVKTVQRQTIVEEVTTTVTRTIKTINQEVNTSSSQQIVNKAVTGPRMANTRPQMRPAMRCPMPAGPQGVAARPPPGPRVANMNALKLAGIPRMPNQVGPSRQTAIRQMRPFHTASKNNAAGTLRPQNPFPKVAPNVQVAPFKRVSGPASARLGPREPRGPAQASCSTELRRVSACSSETVQSSSGVTQMKSKFSSSQESSRVSLAGPARAGAGAAGAGAGAGALAAIQRLQAQGLLVKKPRIDLPEDEGDGDHYSGSDGEDQFDEDFEDV